MKINSVKKADIQLIDSKVFEQRVRVQRTRKFSFEQVLQSTDSFERVW